MFSDHNGIKLGNNNRKATRKSPNTLKLNNIFLNNPWVKEVSKEIKRIHHLVKLKHNMSKLKDAAEEVMRGKCIALMLTLEKKERSRLPIKNIM